MIQIVFFLLDFTSKGPEAGLVVIITDPDPTCKANPDINPHPKKFRIQADPDPQDGIQGLKKEVSFDKS